MTVRYYIQINYFETSPVQQIQAFQSKISETKTQTKIDEKREAKTETKTEIQEETKMTAQIIQFPQGGNQGLFEKYAELHRQAKEIEKQLEEMKPAIVEAIDRLGGKYHIDNCNFSVQERKSYEYSIKVVNLESDLKLLKMNEERTGVAQLSKVNRFPVCRIQKKETASIADTTETVQKVALPF